VRSKSLRRSTEKTKETELRAGENKKTNSRAGPEEGGVSELKTPRFGWGGWIEKEKQGGATCVVAHEVYKTGRSRSKPDRTSLALFIGWRRNAL